MRLFSPVKYLSLLFLFSFQQLSAQIVEDNIVVAQEWEGIHEILHRNDLSPEIHKDAFISANAEKLINLWK